MPTAPSRTEPGQASPMACPQGSRPRSPASSGAAPGPLPCAIWVALAPAAPAPQPLPGPGPSPPTCWATCSPGDAAPQREPPPASLPACVCRQASAVPPRDGNREGIVTEGWIPAGPWTWKGPGYASQEPPSPADRCSQFLLPVPGSVWGEGTGSGDEATVFTDLLFCCPAAERCFLSLE